MEKGGPQAWDLGFGSVPALLGRCEPPGLSPAGTHAGHGRAAGAVPCCWASPLGKASSGIAFSTCLFKFKINLTFPRSGLCKHSVSLSGELPPAQGEPCLSPVCAATVPAG